MRKLHAALLFKNYAQHKWLHLGYVPFECLDELCDEIHENLQIGWNRATELLETNKTCFNHLIPGGRTNEFSCWIVSPRQEWGFFFILEFQRGLKLCSQYKLKHFSSNYSNNKLSEQWSPYQFYTFFHEWMHLLRRHFGRAMFHKYCTRWYHLISTLLKNAVLYLLYFVYLIWMFS